jgi:dipeptidyl-peptidase 4
MKRFYFLVCLAVLWGIVGFSPLALWAAEPDYKDIDLDYLYKKEALHLPPIHPSMPTSLQWSKVGHTLAYLISDGTEAPHLAVYDPIKNATQFLVSPQALHNAIVALATKPSGVTIQPSSAFVLFDDDEKNIARIDRYAWVDEELTLQITVSGKSYRWALEENCLTKAPASAALPEGIKNDVTYSPNQRYAAYTRDRNLFVYDTEEKKEIQLTQDGGASILNGRMTWVYWEEVKNRATWRAFYWSPNSDALAYLQFDEEGVSTYPVTDYSEPVPKTRTMVYPKAGTLNPSVRVGIVALSTRATHWIDLGQPYEYITDVRWKPDGKILSVQAMNREQNHLCLLFIDPITHQRTLVLEEKRSTWVNTFEAPIFLESSDRFLWFSERSGFRHLYVYREDGKLIKPITQGDWDVSEGVVLDEAHSRLYFSSHHPSPLDRHYYSVSLNGGNPKAITTESGTHSLAFSADYKFAIDTFSNREIPKRVDLLSTKGKLMTTLGETTVAHYAPYRIKGPKIMQFENEEGLPFYASIHTPFSFDESKKYPVIVYLYGGPAGQVVRNAWGGTQDMLFVNRGFIYVKFDTRGTANRGRAWIDAIHRNKCDAPLEDLRLLVEQLQALPYVDSEHIGLWGWSNGGYMTCMAMTKAAGLFHAGAAVAPVTDFRLYDTIYTERYLDHPDENQSGYNESSAATYAEQLEGALLLAHGVSDDNVHIQNIYHLVDALIEHGNEYTLYVYPQRDHGIGGDKRRYHLFQQILHFFETHLQSES